MASQYFSAWRIYVKLTWQLPQRTHTYLVDQLLSVGLKSVRTDALARYAKFLQPREVAVIDGLMSDDVKTTTEHNVSLIMMGTGLNPTVATSLAI